MKKRTRSILEELSSLHATRDAHLLIENRGQNIIESAINLLSLVKANFNEDEAGELERRFINAIRGSDPAKFTRGVRKIQESRRAAKKDANNE